MRLQAESIKAQGLLLEEGIQLIDASTQFCAVISIPWIQRRALENSLFNFAFHGLQSKSTENEQDVLAAFCPWNPEG